MINSDKLSIITQVRTLFAQFYAHQDPKELLHDPPLDATLGELTNRLEGITDEDFDAEMQRLLATFGDRHCRYVRTRLVSAVATLPFSITQCTRNGDTIVAISDIDDATGIALVRGLEVTHWNGVPIRKELERFSKQLPAGNPSAAIAQAQRYLTRRPLGFLQPPLEDWVSVTVADTQGERTLRFDWVVKDEPGTVLLGRQLHAPVQDIRFLLNSAIDPVLLAAVESAPESGGLRGDIKLETIEHNNTLFGYIAIPSFAVEDADAFLDSFVRSIAEAPANGVIIDLRGNPGGYAPLGEKLIQTLVPRDVVVSRFHFPITNGTVALCQRTPLFERWRASLLELQRSGCRYSQGFPLEGRDEDYNSIGQQYFGPLAILVDGLTYSTAELFAAGVKDNRASTLLIGTNHATGAGGGNGWPHWILRLFHPAFTIPGDHAQALSSGVLTEELRNQFLGHRVRLSTGAAVATSPDPYGLKWILKDPPNEFTLRLMSWFIEGRIAVYSKDDGALLGDLPDEISLEIPVRRSTRIGPQSGMPIEDLGIIVDHCFALTLRDVVESNVDLLGKACELLSAQPPRSFVWDVQAKQGDVLEVRCRVSGIDRIDFYDDVRPLRSLHVQDNAVDLSFEEPIERLVAKAYFGTELVGTRRLVQVKQVS
ncbi:MAG TPA: S41 family peptidase [Pirellulaceae bacterium]|nr:S41 family peptidase [Pirellulaceae bacterium]